MFTGINGKLFLVVTVCSMVSNCHAELTFCPTPPHSTTPSSSHPTTPPPHQHFSHPQAPRLAPYRYHRSGPANLKAQGWVPWQWVNCTSAPKTCCSAARPRHHHITTSPHQRTTTPPHHHSTPQTLHPSPTHTLSPQSAQCAMHKERLLSFFSPFSVSTSHWYL